MKLCGYKLIMSGSMRRTFIESYHEPADAEALYRLVTLGASSKDIAAPFIVLEYGEELSTTLVSFLPRSRVLVEYDPAGKTREAVQTDARTIRGLGYELAVVQRQGEEPFPAPVDIVVRDYSPVYDSPESAALLRLSRQRRLARRVNTREAFDGAARAGYRYMEGMFFLEADGAERDVVSFASTFFRVMGELRRSEPSFRVLTDIISRDVSLTYKLLKFVNSAYYAPRFPVRNISQAIAILGLNALNQFLTTVAMDTLRQPENAEVIRVSLIRAKFMEQLAEIWGMRSGGSDAYFVGLFSLLDVLISRSMEDILKELPLTEPVQNALLHKSGPLYSILEFTLAYERANWEAALKIRALTPPVQQIVMNAYLSALKWVSAFE
jgi:EAL and modified HD-GYP domain-containing signal transduction protein